MGNGASAAAGSSALGQRPDSLAYILKKMSRHKAAMVGVFMLLALVALSIVANWITPYTFDQIDIENPFQGPTWKHLLGTDELGRDILTRLLYGGRYTLSIGILSVAISASAGIVIGAIAGYFGGRLDNVIMRLLDIIQAFPQMLLAIAISAVLGTGFDKTIIALGLSGIPSFARLMRASILSIRGIEYVEAAVSINCSNARIISKHVVRNAFSPLIVEISMSVAGAGLAASALSFIGLGVQPPTPEWGAMLSAARNYIRDYPHMAVSPGVAIMITILAFNLIGDALRDALDPKLKK